MDSRIFNFATEKNKTDIIMIYDENIYNFSAVNSSGDKESHQCEWNSLNTGMTILLIVTLFLNLLSSVVLFRVPLVTVRGRSNPVYLCIRFLNVCDVLQAFFLVVMQAFATSDCGWVGGELSCSIMGFMVLFFLLVSPLITILMAFDRVIALYQPFKYRSHLGLKMLKILLPSASLLVFLTTILPIFGVGEYHVVKGRRFCLLDTITDNKVDRSYVIGVHSAFLLALLFMLSCTITFQLKLVRMSFTKKHQDFASKSRKKISSKRTRTATITTMAVCGIFVVCYLPYVVRVLVETSRLIKSPTWITWVTFGLAFLQPLLNPVVYVGTNVRYRQELQAMIKNMSATELDTSSESGATQVVSRGPWSGFRRRLSSGGSRNSRRGSNKKRNFGSHTSVNGPLSPGQLGKQELKRGKHANQQKSPLPLTPTDCNGKWKAPTGKKEEEIKCRADPSSSSGVRSFDSGEKILFSPSHLSSSSLAISGSTMKFIADGPKYGRGIRDLEPMRERSNTVSGDKSPGLTNEKNIPLFETQHCASVPTLLDRRRLPRNESADNASKMPGKLLDQHLQSDHCLLKRRSRSLDNLNISSSNEEVCQRDPNRQKEILSHSSVELKSEKVSLQSAQLLLNNLPGQVNSNKELPQVYIAGSNDSVHDQCFNDSQSLLLLNDQETSPKRENFPYTNGIDISPIRSLALKRSEGRSSYKKALEISGPFFIERKPSKRDSGVGEA